MRNFVTKTAYAALVGLSHLALDRYGPRVVGVSGTMGVAITGQAITAVLSHAYRVRTTLARDDDDGFFFAILNLKIQIRGVFAAFLAVPYAVGLATASRKSRYPEALVLTYGKEGSGRVRELLRIARPTIAVLTSFAGIQFLSDDAKPDGVRLLESLTSGGYAVLNIDDQGIARAGDRTRGKILTFGFHPSADMRIMNYGERDEGDRETGIFFKLHYGGSFVPIRMRGVQGREFAYAAAASAAVGVAFGINLLQIAETLSKADLLKNTRA